ncbi:hypothetical protein [Comamonas sp. HJ-2]
MAALTSSELFTAAKDDLSNFPTVAQLVKAGDPRILMQLSAQSVMLSMLSAQVEVAKYEPFNKSRDGTVLADAALKGILPLGRACRVTLEIKNNDTEPVTLGSQRRILDAKGRLYELDAAVSIPAGMTSTVTGQQIRRRTVTHEVDTAADFYSMEVPQASDGLYLNTLTVSKGAEVFRYAPDWFNVKPGEKAYQVEVDNLRLLYVRFGKSTVVGYGVSQGDGFTMEITECNGRLTDLAPGDNFNLEYVFNAPETNLALTLKGIDDEGASPHTIEELRVMAKYPAVYDHNAVYLGEFTFLLRRYISGFRFLSIWNEQVEEAVRGANVSNINTLFVSGLVKGMSASVFNKRAAELLNRADGSYKYKFVATSLQAVPVTVTAAVAISWDRALVESQIRAVILGFYGDGSINVSEGMSNPIRKAQINRLLRENVPALRDEKAEFDVAVSLPAAPKPEHFLHIAPDSLTVNVSSSEYGSNLWNH